MSVCLNHVSNLLFYKLIRVAFKKWIWLSAICHELAPASLSRPTTPPLPTIFLFFSHIDLLFLYVLKSFITHIFAHFARSVLNNLPLSLDIISMCTFRYRSRDSYSGKPSLTYCHLTQAVLCSYFLNICC